MSKRMVGSSRTISTRSVARNWPDSFGGPCWQPGRNSATNKMAQIPRLINGSMRHPIGLPERIPAPQSSANLSGVRKLVFVFAPPLHDCANVILGGRKTDLLNEDGTVRGGFPFHPFQRIGPPGI